MDNPVLIYVYCCPQIASLYVDDPVLIERQDVGHVKFDLRFVVMLASVKPLSLYIYKKFLIRYANMSVYSRNL